MPSVVLWLGEVQEIPQRCQGGKLALELGQMKFVPATLPLPVTIEDRLTISESTDDQFGRPIRGSGLKSTS